jgi:iron complex outermembrane recepter protein
MGQRKSARGLMRTLVWSAGAECALTGQALAASPNSSDQLQEVVVTAARQGEQALQTVPMSITAVDPQSSAQEGLQNLSDIGRLVPGVAIQDQGAGRNNVHIRGVSDGTQVDDTNVEHQELVSVYLDEIPISTEGANPDLRVVDLERVEFIRGPQGTLYGAGAMAGTIRYLTRKPDTTHYQTYVETTGAGTDAGAASYSVHGAVNLPVISDEVGFRLNVYQGRDGGYIDNVGPAGQPNSNWTDISEFRAALRFKNDSPLTVDASYFFGLVQTGGLFYSFSDLGPYQVNTDIPQQHYDKFKIANLTADYQFPWADLISSTSYTDRYTELSDSFEYLINYYVYGYNAPSLDLNRNNINDFTEEVRLASRAEGKLRWQTGVFWEHQNRRELEDVPTPGLDAFLGTPSLAYGAFSQNDLYSQTQNPITNQLALFGEATYSPLKKWDLTLGLRYYHWRQSYTTYSGGFFGAADINQPLSRSGVQNENGVNPRVIVTHRPTDATMVFAEAARGFRGGGVNQPIPLSICGQLGPPTFGSDHLWSYSLGEKSSVLNNRLRINATAFLIKWTQAQTLHTLPCSYFYVENKGDIRSRGIELESRLQVTHALSVGIAASYTDAVADGPIPNLNSQDGDRVPDFPPVIATLLAEYTTPTPLGELRIQGDYSYRSDTHTAFNVTDPVYRLVPASKVLNAGLTIKIRPKVQVGLFARNLTNARVITDVERNPEQGVQPGDRVYLGRPRTIGLRLRVDF